MSAWVCPPVGKIVETIKRVIRSRQMAGILVVPVWRSAVFWPFVCPDGHHVTECFGEARVFRPFLLQGETNEAGNTLMRGRTKFEFLELYITNAGQGRMTAGRVELPWELR